MSLRSVILRLLPGLFMLAAACNLVSAAPEIVAIPTVSLPTAATASPMPATATATATTTPPKPQAPPSATPIPLPVIAPPGSPAAENCWAMPQTAGDQINVRTQPGQGYAIIALLKTYALVRLASNGWYEIIMPDGRYAWVSGQVTRLVGNCSLVVTPSATSNSTVCRFVPGGNAQTVQLYVAPRGAVLGVFTADQLVVLAQQDGWYQVISPAVPQSGYVPDTSGSILGLCSGIPTIPTVNPNPGPCLIGAITDTPFYSKPDPHAPQAGILKAGQTVQAVVHTNDGWYGYQIGIVPPKPPYDLSVLMWLPAGNPLGNALSPNVACPTTPLVVYPS